MEKHMITQEALAAYKAHLEQEERGNATVEKYLRDVGELRLWLVGEPLTKDKLAAWKHAVQEKGRKPATVNSKLAAVNSFLRFMGWQECQVKFLRLQRRMFREQAKELTRTDYEKLLQTALNRKKPRLALLLETICATGVRVSEVRYITVEAARRGQTEIALKG